MKPLVQVETFILEEQMSYRNTPVLTYRIAYPQMRSTAYPRTAERINAYYRLEAMRQQINARVDLYRQAVQQYHEAVENGYPMMEYQLVTAFTVTYNQGCLVSLYSDRYVFTGGAHGNTVRYAQTWDMRTGRTLSLDSLTPGFLNSKEYFTTEVIRQISAQTASGEGAYFDEYRVNAVKEFDPAQFYLTPQGVAIYYQQYAIAPYSSGIPVFIVPYSRLVRLPRC